MRRTQTRKTKRPESPNRRSIQRRFRSSRPLCFFAGANSIFSGQKLLTAPNPPADRDRNLKLRLGLSPMEPI
ncbi:MAG: hypothetical protein WBF58_16490 [Xanthobacteraceae bacterium]